MSLELHVSCVLRALQISPRVICYARTHYDDATYSASFVQLAASVEHYMLTEFPIMLSIMLV